MDTQDPNSIATQLQRLRQTGEISQAQYDAAIQKLGYGQQQASPNPQATNTAPQQTPAGAAGTVAGNAIGQIGKMVSGGIGKLMGGSDAGGQVVDGARTAQVEPMQNQGQVMDYAARPSGGAPAFADSQGLPSFAGLPGWAF